MKILFVPIKVASVTNNTILTFFDTHNLRSKNFVLESKCKIFMPVVSSDKMAGEPLVHTLIFYLPSVGENDHLRHNGSSKSLFYEQKMYKLLYSPYFNRFDLLTFSF